MKKIYEIAEHTVSNRNKVIYEESIERLIAEKGSTSPLFRSVFWYDEGIQEHRKTTKSVGSYFGLRGIDWIPIDIDKGKNSDEYTLKKLRDFITTLAILNVGEDSYQIYFSGTGYHVFISNGVFDFEPGEDLPKIVSMTLENLKLIDDKSIVRGSQLIRMEHSLNEKSGLYKIPLTLDEVVALDPEGIKELAKTQRLDFNYEEKYGTGQLSDYVISSSVLAPAEKALEKDAAYKGNYAVCVQTLYANGPQEGERNNALLRMASHFKRNGIPRDACEFAMLGWNKKTQQSLDEKVVLSKVASVYTSPYLYGCTDPLLMRYCARNCLFYKNKDLETAVVQNVYDLDKSLDEHFMMRENKDSHINLRHIFGLDIDCVLYPGELVVIQGDTGTNKTSIVQNIILGVDMVNDVVRPHKMPILYYGPELHAGTLMMRNYCIVTGYDEETFKENYEDRRRFQSTMNNISVQQGALTIKGIENMIKKYQPAVLVIDYYEQVEHPAWDRSSSIAIAEIAKKLSAMAVRYNITIIAVSQINRDGAKNGNNVHAGFGSGAIEKTARRLIIIEGKQDSPYRTISQVKANSDASWGGIIIERQDNWRFKRIN